MTRNRAAVLLLASAAAIGSSGCATIISGTTQTVTIDSTPPGAYVRIGEHSGTTPVTLSLPKGNDYTVIVSHGSDKRVVTLNRNLDPIALLNMIPPLWPGFIIDTMTGAITKYDASVVSVNFNQQARLTRFGQPRTPARFRQPRNPNRFGQPTGPTRFGY